MSLNLTKGYGDNVNVEAFISNHGNNTVYNLGLNLVLINPNGNMIWQMPSIIYTLVEFSSEPYFETIKLDSNDLIQGTYTVRLYLYDNSYERNIELDRVEKTFVYESERVNVEIVSFKIT